MRATCPDHLILIYVIILIIINETYKLEAPRYAIFSSLMLLPPSLFLNNKTTLKRIQYDIWLHDCT
jgi:hypothetical protein